MRKWDKKEFEQVGNSKAWFAFEGRLDKDVLPGKDISWTNTSV